MVNHSRVENSNMPIEQHNLADVDHKCRDHTLPITRGRGKYHHPIKIGLPMKVIICNIRDHKKDTKDLLRDMIRDDQVLHLRNTLKDESYYMGRLFLQILCNIQDHLKDGGRFFVAMTSIRARAYQWACAIGMGDHPSRNAYPHLLLKTTKSHNRHLNLRGTKLL